MTSHTKKVSELSIIIILLLVSAGVGYRVWWYKQAHPAQTEMQGSADAKIQESSQKRSNPIATALDTLAVKAEDQARAKARDAKRIAELKQFVYTFDVINAATPNIVIPCKGSNPIINSSNCSGFSTYISDWNSIKDPVAGKSDVACSNSITKGASCAYTLKTGSTTNHFEICFALEQENPLGSAGVYAIGPGATFQPGCSYKQ